MADEKSLNHGSDSEGSEGEDAYTLDELGEMYESANAVLGGSDPNNCSYGLGYVKRQALYACMTCNPAAAPNAEKAGVCLACANKCHENHQLVELYTKRAFRCDCGNKKFPVPCQLLPEKDATNIGNSYNHNFSGLYCTCDRPYPDPDDDDEMIQCIVCEDWYHSRHAFGYHSERVAVGDGSDVDCEMICEKCTSNCDFLKSYGGLRANITIKPEVSEESPIVAEATNGSDVPMTSSQGTTNELKLEIDGDSRASPPRSEPASQNQLLASVVEPKNDSSQETRDSGIALSDSNEATSDIVVTDSDPEHSTTKECLLKKSSKVDLPSTATMWIKGWRSKLCKCDSCMNMYYKVGVGFIVDDEDTLYAYEELGQAKLEEEEKEKEEAFTDMWSKLDHVTKVEAMIGLNEMKEHLREFLQKHDGKIVRKRDAEEFVEELKAKRAKRVERGGIPPNSCH